MAIRYILWQFGIYFPALVFWTKKNLATLLTTKKQSSTNSPVKITKLNECLSRVGDIYFSVEIFRPMTQFISVTRMSEDILGNIFVQKISPTK
jgi:hypothetical protein